MRKLIGLIFLLSNITVLNGQHYNKIYGNPLIVLQKTGTFRALGSDITSFALYEHGQIIYKKVAGKKTTLFNVNLKKEEIKQTIKSLGFTDSLQLLPKFISASNSTDLITYKLILRFDSLKEISVYGYLDDPNDRLNTPKSFLKVYDNIDKFDNKSAKVWLPDSIEVILFKLPHPQKKPLNLPKGWLSLKNTAILNGYHNLNYIYVDKKQFTTLIKLIDRSKQRVIEINRQDFAFYFRLPFPNIE